MGREQVIFLMFNAQSIASGGKSVYHIIDHITDKSLIRSDATCHFTFEEEEEEEGQQQQQQQQEEEEGQQQQQQQQEEEEEDSIEPYTVSLSRITTH